MANDELSIGDLIRSGESYDQIYTFDHDISFYQTWAKKTGGPILEMCCGTGRITIPVAQLGLEVTGIDFTQSMLDRAKEKAAKSSVNVTLINADIRNFDLRKTFKFIMIPFNSLEDIYTLKDLEKVFNCISFHADRDTLIAFDINNSKISNLLDGKRTVPINTEIEMSGKRVHIAEKMTFDPIKQCNRVQRTYTNGNEKIEVPLDLRVYFPEEMKALINYNGLEIVHRFGDFDESPLSPESDKQIFICRPKN